MAASRIDIHPRHRLLVKTKPAPCERRSTHEPVQDRTVCQVDGCHAAAQPVYRVRGGEITGWLCDEHAVSAGYCNACRVYIADKPEERTTWAFYGRCQACTEDLLL